MRFFILLLIILGYFFGLYFYCRGFLLSRQTLLMKSSCVEVQHPNPYQSDDERINSSPSGCWIEAKYRKAILIVIDALRFDFVRPQPVNSANPFYHNKLDTISNLLKTQPTHSLLFEFTADPPTTTLQRLKALTTGSLPTFIDAGSNFAGYAIEEDNLLDQLVEHNRNITFLGDDTWLALFPTQINRKFPFPSFDVKDLHTVDNGILDNIYNELERKDWTLLIAHFLGVDHCGHKYGPSHNEMSKKLTQMDQVLNNVTKYLDDDTLLLVFGDHGMTENGDHGGDSQNELSAAVFMYSTKPLHSTIQNIKSSVSQVDLVPTLSLLLDVPIPFSNLGSLMSDVFEDKDQLLQAEKANAWQVVRYAENYAKSSADANLREKLDPLLKIFYSLSSEELTIERCIQFLQQLQSIFRDSWAKFHLGWMTLGILSLIETFLWSVRLVFDYDQVQTGRRGLLKFVSILMGFAAVLGRNESIPRALGAFISLQVIIDLHGFATGLLNRHIERLPSVTSLLSLGIVIIHSLSFFANSFVINEHTTVRYLTQTLLVIMFFSRPSPKNTTVDGPRFSSRTKTFGLKQLIASRFGFKFSIYCFVALVIVRMGSFFTRCREEHIECHQYWTVMSFASLTDDLIKQIRFFLAVGSIICICFLIICFLQRNGHLDGYKITVFLCRFSLPLCTFMIIVYWTSLWLPESVLVQYPILLERLPPLTVYGILSIFLLVLLWKPYMIHFKDSKRKQINNDVFLNKSRLFRHVKENWTDYLGEQKLSVFGLASSFSGAFVAFFGSFILLLALLLGDGLAPSLLGFIIVNVIALELSGSLSSSVILISLWSLLSSYYFYSFAHQPTFTAIPWDAAFIGIPGNFQFQSVQAVLVFANIFASHILVSLLVPLSVIWPVYPMKLGTFALNCDGKTDTEYSLLTNTSATSVRVWTASLHYLVINALKVLIVTVGSAVHRRHLMVWKIFAPKFIFEGISFIVSCFALLFTNFLVWRLSRRAPNVVVESLK